MRLRDRPPLFIALVRAADDADLRTAVGGYTAPARANLCTLHPAEGEAIVATSGPYRGQSACLACVARSRAARAIGISGGHKGGRSRSEKKLAALDVARGKRWKKRDPKLGVDSESGS